MDGGYMRSLWCISHTAAIALLLLVLCTPRPKLLFFYPAILQQSVYALGLIVLTLATLPKLLVAIFAEPNPTVLTLIFIFFCGMAGTWFFTLVLWHWYWHLEALYDKDAVQQPSQTNAAVPPATNAALRRDEGLASDEEQEEGLLTDYTPALSDIHYVEDEDEEDTTYQAHSTSSQPSWRPNGSLLSPPF